MRVTKKQLNDKLAALNDKYCKGTQNKLAVSEGYGGYSVVLTGKDRGRGIGGNIYDVTFGHVSARECIEALQKREKSGTLMEKISHCENISRRFGRR